jgi:DNA repair protein RadC
MNSLLKANQSKSKEPQIMETKYEIKTIKVKVKLREGALPAVTSPERVVETVREIYKNLDADQEHFVILTMNVQNEVEGFKVVASGMMDQVAIDPKILFRSALLLGASGLILVHNHPSGHTNPSDEDKRLTRTIKEASDLLGIRLLDHIVIGSRDFFSFLKYGLI